MRPNEALAGRADTESQRGLQLRRAMTVLQLATAMGFAGFTSAALLQTGCALRAAPGFDPAPLLIVDLPDDDKERDRMPGLIAVSSDWNCRRRQVAGRAWPAQQFVAA